MEMAIVEVANASCRAGRAKYPGKLSLTQRRRLAHLQTTSKSDFVQYPTDYEAGIHFSLSDLYMNEYWTDPGLAYAILNPCQGNLSFDWTVLQNIWTPNTCFVNSKKAQIHSSPFRNVFLMVFPNGEYFIELTAITFVKTAVLFSSKHKEMSITVKQNIYVNSVIGSWSFLRSFFKALLYQVADHLFAADCSPNSAYMIWLKLYRKSASHSPLGFRNQLLELKPKAERDCRNYGM